MPNPSFDENLSNRSYFLGNRVICGCASPGFAAVDYLDCISALEFLVCRQLLPVDPSPVPLLVGIRSSATEQMDILRFYIYIYKIVCYVFMQITEKPL